MRLRLAIVEGCGGKGLGRGKVPVRCWRSWRAQTQAFNFLDEPHSSFRAALNLVQRHVEILACLRNDFLPRSYIPKMQRKGTDDGRSLRWEAGIY